MRLKRLVFLVVLIGAIFYIKSIPQPKGVVKVLSDKINQGQKTAENVLGATTRRVNKTLFRTTVSSLTDQIKKLPVDQQREIKRNLCK